MVSKRARGGARRRKAVRLLAVRHRKVERVRRDWHHQVAGRLVRQHDVIAVEYLNVRGLQRGMLAESVGDVAWGQFLQILGDKAASAGRLLVSVDPRDTSQQCGACGVMPATPKALASREHRCDCGYVAPRDLNAARNILHRVQRMGRADPSASRPAFKAAA